MIEGRVEEEIQGDMSNSKYVRKKSSTLEASWNTYTYTQRVQMKLPYNVTTVPLLANTYRKQNQATTKKHH